MKLEIGTAPCNRETKKKLMTTVQFQTVEGTINQCILSGRELGNISKPLKILFEPYFRYVGIYSTEAIRVIFKNAYIKYVY